MVTLLEIKQHLEDGDQQLKRHFSKHSSKFTSLEKLNSSSLSSTVFFDFVPNLQLVLPQYKGLSNTMAGFVGKYQYETAENIEEYLKGLGVGLVFRKVQTAAKPTVEITLERDTNLFTFKTESIFRTRVINFKLGEAFQDETYDLRKCQTTVKLDGESKLIIEQVCEEGPNVTEVRELTDCGLKVVFESGQFRASQTFKKSSPTAQSAATPTLPQS